MFWKFCLCFPIFLTIINGERQPCPVCFKNTKLNISQFQFPCSVPPDCDVNSECVACTSTPEQVHIAFGDESNEIVVVWSTKHPTHQSIVEYGDLGLTKKATGSSKLFVDGGSLKRSQWIHRVTLRNLDFNETYAYHCGSDHGWSELFFFTTPPSGNRFTVTAAIFGDMGSVNAQALPLIADEIKIKNNYDVILHVGDFAYDMDSNNAEVGDEFMRKIEPIAAYVPYMTCPGNHEEKYNFSNYKNRFAMPYQQPNDGSMYYSFDLGPVHFVSINTEAYFFLQYGAEMVHNQYYWLIEDLEKASSYKQRKITPWIVLFGHRPMYCSNSDDIDCDYSEGPTRVGLIPFMHLYALEPVLMKYGVDIVIWAHEHTYERSWPIYDYQIFNGSTEKPYFNAGAPIHIVTGSAGCSEGRDRFHFDPPNWSAFRSQDYGFTRFAAYNATHIYMEQVSADLHGAIIDSFWIGKNQQNFGRIV